MADNRVIDSYRSYDQSQIKNTIVERSFTFLPDINHVGNLHGDAIVIWLDDTIGTSMESQWFNIAGQLRQIIDHVEVFTNVNECIEYIDATGIEQVFLIVRGTYGDDFDAKLFQEIINDVFIYVLTSDNSEYTRNLTRIRGYFDNANKLIEQIHSDYMVYASNTMSDINFIEMNTTGSTTRCINPQLVRWKCSQLMFDILRRMPCPREQSMRRLIEFLISQYRDNSMELKPIHEFETIYHPNLAIHWYTKGCFLYSLINRSCRTHDIDAIMDFSFVTVDIYNQLHELHSKQYLGKESSVIVYRGQLMRADEFQKLRLNIGRFVSNNSMFSVSRDYEVALLFTLSGLIGPDVRVLFEISLGSNSSASKPFADISGLSYFLEDQEVLFINGTIFRIVSCEKSPDNYWIIQLTLCDSSCPVVENSSDYFEIAMLQLLEILPKISPKTNKANDRMLQWWRLYCKDDPIELAKADQFEESYRSDSAIRWYTKDSVLYRLVNTALRQENIDMIVDFRYFIIDLYEQLTKSHLDYLRSFKERSLTVYRGQKISLLELRRLKHSIGKYISIKSFFSASLSSGVALCFAELDESDRKQLLQSVLFQIDIDMSRLAQSGKNHLFAHIMNLSSFVHEEEVLFMANTRFRIESITNWNGIFWVVRLTLLSLDDENDDEMKTMNRYLNYLTNLVIKYSGDSICLFLK